MTTFLPDRPNPQGVCAICNEPLVYMGFDKDTKEEVHHCLCGMTERRVPEVKNRHEK